MMNGCCEVGSVVLNSANRHQGQARRRRRSMSQLRTCSIAEVARARSDAIARGAERTSDGTTVAQSENARVRDTAQEPGPWAFFTHVRSLVVDTPPSADRTSLGPARAQRDTCFDDYRYSLTLFETRLRKAERKGRATARVSRVA